MFLTCNLLQPSHSDQLPKGPHWQLTLWLHILENDIQIKQFNEWQHIKYNSQTLKWWKCSLNQNQIYPLVVNRKRSHRKTLAQCCATFCGEKKKKRSCGYSCHLNITAMTTQNYYLTEIISVIKFFVSNRWQKSEKKGIWAKSTCLHVEGSTAAE